MAASRALGAIRLCGTDFCMRGNRLRHTLLGQMNLGDRFDVPRPGSALYRHGPFEHRQHFVQILRAGVLVRQLFQGLRHQEFVLSAGMPISDPKRARHASSEIDPN